MWYLTAVRRAIGVAIKAAAKEAMNAPRYIWTSSTVNNERKDLPERKAVWPVVGSLIAP